MSPPLPGIPGGHPEGVPPPVSNPSRGGAGPVHNAPIREYAYPPPWEGSDHIAE